MSTEIKSMELFFINASGEAFFTMEAEPTRYQSLEEVSSVIVHESDRYDETSSYEFDEDEGRLLLYIFDTMPVFAHYDTDGEH